MKWYEEAMFYQFYPLAFAKGPYSLSQLEQWTDHITSLCVNAVYLAPVFESEDHGYDTIDYYQVDHRLGDNNTLINLVNHYHERGMKVVLDAVFNHTGRGFFAFQDILEKREKSRYIDWYKDVNFANNNGYNDGFSYQGWEGCDNLVLLNTENEEVVRYLVDVALFWVKTFHIDGLRFDCAYSLPKSFLHTISQALKSYDPDIFLLGEVVHGTYKAYVGEGMLDSVTDYELHQSLFHSHNSKNYFELAHTIERQFNSTDSVGAKLYNFVDNHDVDRLASKISDKRDLFLVYALMYFLPGIPSLYYGDEWGAQGKKINGDDSALRPYFDMNHLSIDNQPLLDHIRALSYIRKTKRQFYALADVRCETLTNTFIKLSRNFEKERVCLYVNMGDEAVTAPLDANARVRYNGDVMGNDSIRIKAHNFSWITVS